MHLLPRTWDSEANSPRAARVDACTVHRVILGMLLGGWSWCGLSPQPALAARGGTLRLTIVDADTRAPLAVRIHLQDRHGRRVLPRAKGVLRHHDHFVVNGRVTLNLRSGQYSFLVEAGPEFRHRTGHFEIDDHADDQQQIEMHRHARLSEEGWYGGDLYVARRKDHAPLLLAAEGLSVVPLLSAKNIRGKHTPVNPWGRAAKGKTRDAPVQTARVAAYLDYRFGGSLLIANPQTPLNLAQWPAWESSPEVLHRARAAAAHVDVAMPFAWDLPVWLAKRVDSFQLIGSHSLRDQAIDHEADGRARDRVLFPGAIGNGRWTETIYCHALNAGLRLPPTAGSGSGDTSNPVGQNRVYVHCGKEFSYEAWWKGLRAGKVFVTNGPLLRAHVDGQPPGAVFRLEAGETRDFEIALKLSTRKKIEYLQIVKNGQIEHEVRLDQFAAQGGRLPKVRFRSSGWFLVRVVTNNTKVYQFASTGPFYVESPHEPRVSRQSVQFFQDWLRDIPHRANLGNAYAEAQEFWQRRLDKANVP